MRNLIMIAALAAAFGAGHFVTAKHYREKIAVMERDQAQAELSNALAAGVQEAEWTKTVEDARNDATIREQAIRRDAAGARSELDGLRDELAAIRQSLPDLADDAVRQRADTVARLFGECAREYQELAERADRHASDVKTLSEAWPP